MRSLLLLLCCGGAFAYPVEIDGSIDEGDVVLDGVISQSEGYEYLGESNNTGEPGKFQLYNAYDAAQNAMCFAIVRSKTDDWWVDRDFAIAIDVDQIAGSGATTGTNGLIRFTGSTYLPDYTMIAGVGTQQDALTSSKWNGTSWESDAENAAQAM